MQEFRNEWNEHRIDKLEKKVDILIDGVSSNWEGTTNSFKAILDALETLKDITTNLDTRIRRLESIVLFKEEETE